MRIALVVAVVVFCSGLAWGNGDFIRYDPHTGVIQPAGPTPAQIEKEELTVEFIPAPKSQEEQNSRIDYVQVIAAYNLINPTDKPLELKIGFPISGNAPRLVETPVLLDDKPVSWKLISHNELLQPMLPELVKAVRAWQKQHPRVMQLADEMRHLHEQTLPRGERRKKEEGLWQQLRAELVKAGVRTPDRQAAEALRPTVGLSNDFYSNIWEVHRAVSVTGQQALLPEGRWHVAPTYLDPASGKEIPPPQGGYDSMSVSMLEFTVPLEPNSAHILKVKYRQRPEELEEWDPENSVGYQFQYVLSTTGGWASFGPIDISVTAPSDLVFRSLPVLQEISHNNMVKVYHTTLNDPKRNLQIVLAKTYLLLPRLKVNGDLTYTRYDMLDGETIRIPRSALKISHKMYLPDEIELARLGKVIRTHANSPTMTVNGKQKKLAAPVVIKQGVSYLPLEVIRELYPDSEVSLTYHKPSNTVLLSIKQRKIPTPR